MLAVLPEAVFLTGLAALWLDRLVGYPLRLRHPVELFGAVINWGDSVLNKTPGAAGRSRLAGFALVFGLCVFVGAGAAGVTIFLRQWTGGFVLETLLAAPFLASKSLVDHVRAVDSALGQNLAAARKAVGQIVGRETGQMQESDVVKGAVESLAENASDGVFAPLFWFLVAGLPGIVIYKVINTADSMIGYKSERYEHFGWFAARLDDVVNFIPARLTGLLFVVAAALTNSTNASATFSTMLADARKHKSPNAGWPEAAMAGALGVTLGGVRAYGGVKVELPAMGDGRDELVRQDIGAALELFDRTVWVATILLVALGLMVWL